VYADYDTQKAESKGAKTKAKNKTAGKKVNNTPETSEKQRSAAELGMLSSLPLLMSFRGWHWDYQTRLSIPEGVSWLRREKQEKKETHNEVGSSNHDRGVG